MTDERIHFWALEIMWAGFENVAERLLREALKEQENEFVRTPPASE